MSNNKKKYIDVNWPELLENYFCGMPRLELERRYNVPIRTIYRYIKKIMIDLVTNPSSVIRRNWPDVVNDIKKTIGGMK